MSCSGCFLARRRYRSSSRCKVKRAKDASRCGGVGSVSCQCKPVRIRCRRTISCLVGFKLLVEAVVKYTLNYVLGEGRKKGDVHVDPSKVFKNAMRSHVTNTRDKMHLSFNMHMPTKAHLKSKAHIYDTLSPSHISHFIFLFGTLYWSNEKQTFF